MAKPKASTHSTTVKPLTSRPLDLLYYGFFVFHFICTIAIDILPLWPEQLRTLPVGKQLFGIFKGVVDDYTLKTNDPFMLATWGLVQREWEFLFLKVFMWMEVFIQIPSFVIGMIGLQRDSPRVYPLLLAYSSAALVTTTTVLVITLAAPSASDKTLDPISKFYAMSDEGRWTILGPLIPFLIVPAVMWIDMMVRVGRLVEAGIRATGAGNAKSVKKDL